MLWIAALILGCKGADIPDEVNVDPVPEFDALVESMPNSTHHSNATWWGYNMNKIVRHGSRVYTHVIDNDKAAGQPFDFVIYHKDGDGPWAAGASFPTSRPGNLLVDSEGVLHAFVFEAFDMVQNDSVGKLVHYWFPTPGDLTIYEQETVVENDGSRETVNIRVGSAISAADRLSVGWGIRLPSPDDDSIQVVHRGADEDDWTVETPFTGLGHDFFYPFMLATDTGFVSVHVQDDYVASNESNIYQIVDYYRKDNGNWTSNRLIDLTGHELADEQRIMLEVSELYQTSDGRVHVFIKEFLQPERIRHFIDDGDTVAEVDFEFGRYCSWLRMIEIEEETFYFCGSNEALYMRAESGEVTLSVPFHGEIGGYLYLAAPRGGTALTEEYIDALFISGASGQYPDGPSVYIRISKSEILQLSQ